MANLTSHHHAERVFIQAQNNLRNNNYGVGERENIIIQLVSTQNLIFSPILTRNQYLVNKFTESILNYDTFDSFWESLHPAASQVESETSAGWSSAQKVATATVTSFVVLGLAFYWA